MLTRDWLQPIKSENIPSKIIGGATRSAFEAKRTPPAIRKANPAT
jgi:hypothetical protein